MRLPFRRGASATSPGPTPITGPFNRDGGFCVTADIPTAIAETGAITSWDAPGWELLEDGTPLGIVTADHDEIRRLGHGRYCFWGDSIYFPALDGSTPGENGRTYEVAPAGSRVTSASTATRSGGSNGGLDPFAVPGMIVRAECDLIEEVACAADLTAGRIVEVGPFFGRSTTALLRGAMANPTFTDRAHPQPVISVDRFAWPVADAHIVGDVEEFIRSLAAQADVDHLVTIGQGAVRFQPVFDHFVGATGLVETVTVDLRLMDPIASGVVVLFLDGPKTSDELHAVFDAVAGRLTPGASIVFQDFFVHTSGELIGSIGALIAAGILTPTRAVASTLLCTWQGGDWRTAWPPDRTALLANMATTRELVADVGSTNDPTHFMARLLLAQAQLALACDRPREASELLRELRATYGVRAETWNDLADLVSVGFASTAPAPPTPVDPPNPKGPA